MVMLLVIILLWQQVLSPDASVTIIVGAEPVELSYGSGGAEIIGLEVQDLSTEADLDLVVEVLRAGDRLLYDDINDSADRSYVLLSEAGDYTIRVHTFNGVQTGEVEVTLISQPWLATCAPDEITLIAQQAYSCYLELQAGEHVSVAVRDTSGTLDPVLRLYSEDTNLLIMNDDHGTQSTQLNVLDAAISDHTVASTGRYLVMVSDFSGAAGTFELSLDHAG